MGRYFTVYSRAAAALCGLVACSSTDTQGQPAPTVDASVDAAVLDPATDAGAPDAAPNADDARAGDHPHVVYLNFHGALLEPAIIDDAPAGKSSMLQNLGTPKGVFSGFAGANVPVPDRVSRQHLLDKVVAIVTATVAPFDVQITTRRPTVPFTEILFGGTTEDFGADEGTAGQAPLDCGDLNPTNVGIVYADSKMDFRPAREDEAAPAFAHTILHELGHTWGLAHTVDPADIMTPAGTALAWGTGGAVAPSSSGSCGRTTQDSKSILLSQLGPHVDRTPVPTVADEVSPIIAASAPSAAAPPGLSITTSHASCVRVGPSADVVGAYAEVWRRVGSTWLRVSHAATTTKTNGAFRFAPVMVQGPDEVFERIGVLDSSDNVTEVQAWLLASEGGAAVGTCE